MPGGAPDPSVRSLVRLVLLFRLIALNMTIFELPESPDQVPSVMADLMIAAMRNRRQLRASSTSAAVTSSAVKFRMTSEL